MTEVYDIPDDPELDETELEDEPTPITSMTTYIILSVILLCISMAAAAFNGLHDGGELSETQKYSQLCGRVAAPGIFALIIIALASVRKKWRTKETRIKIAFYTLLLFAFGGGVNALEKLGVINLDHGRPATIKPFTFKAPPDFADYPAGMKNTPHILQSYIKGNPQDRVPDIILLVEDLGGWIKKQDMSKYVKGKENVRLLHEQWQGHEIPVFEIKESFGELTTLTYNAQVPVLPKAIQIKVIGLESLRMELRNILKAALKNADGTTNWRK